MMPTTFCAAPGRAPARLLAVLPTLLIAVGVTFPREASAQDQRRRGAITNAVQDSFAYRTATFSPRSGPPGTPVAVRWQYLPALTPVRLGLGAQRVGFQVLKEVLTDSRGEVNDTIVIPYWAEPERTHLLVVHDFYFHTLAVSSEFTVTSPEGVFRREGTIVESTSRCALLEGDGGQLYHLLGDTGPLEVGERVVVEGSVADAAQCGAESHVTMSVTRVLRPFRPAAVDPGRRSPPGSASSPGSG